MKKRVVVAAVFTMFSGVVTQAQMLGNPISRAPADQLYGEAALRFGETEYDKGTIKRNMLTASLARGVAEHTDVYVGLGYSIKSELDGEPVDGSGMALGIGARHLIRQVDKALVSVYGELRYLSDDLGSLSESFDEYNVSVDVESTLTEVAIGVVGVYAVDNRLKVYGALELVPFSDGEVEISVDSNIPSYYYYWYDLDDVIESEEGKFSFERDSMIGIRLGAEYAISNELKLQGEVSIINEQMVTIGIGRAF